MILNKNVHASYIFCIRISLYPGVTEDLTLQAFKYILNPVFEFVFNMSSVSNFIHVQYTCKTIVLELRK